MHTYDALNSSVEANMAHSEIVLASKKLQAVMNLLGSQRLEEISADFRGRVIIPRKLEKPSQTGTRKYVSRSGRVYFLKEENAGD